MRAVVLVGGFGTRLRPLTLNSPKQMLPVVGVTMFERVIAALGRHGVDEAIISLGYRPDRFIEAWPSGVCAGVRLHYAAEPEPLDTAGAIRFAAESAGVDETFIVVNGDVLTDLDYAWLVERHHEFGAEATLHLVPVDEPSRFGVVPTDESGRVLEFVEKPAAGTEPTNYINAGTYVMEPSVLARIEPGRKVSVEREVFPAMAAAGTLFAVGTDDYWLDAGTPEALVTANLDLVDGHRSVIETAVSPTAKLEDGCVVEHSVVGSRVCISSGARIVDSVVMDDVTIGADAVIERSIVASGATIGAGAIVTNQSVVGFDATVGDGVRLDAATEPPASSWLT